MFLKKYIHILLSVIFIIFIISINLYAAATLPDPGTQSTTIFTTVNSDFGPRQYTTSSGTVKCGYHAGIDYKIQTTDKGHVVEAGNITEINLSPDGKPKNARIVIADKWRYVHMEDDKSSDDNFQVYQSGHSIPGSSMATLDRDVIVFRSGSTSSLSTDKVLHKTGMTPSTFSFKDPETGNVVTTQTSVSQNDWIFVPNSGENHLHLDYKNGEKSPFRYVAHTSSNTDPTLELKFQKEKTSGEAEDFPDNKVYGNPVIIQCKVDSQSDKDHITTRIYIKKSSESSYPSSHFKRWRYEGPGLTTSQIKKKDPESEIKKAKETGVYPVKDIVSIDYFKKQWNTKEKEGGGEAKCPDDDPKWPDGKYKVKLTHVCHKSYST